LTKILGSRDCGNSPKNRFVQDLAVSMECGNPIPEAFDEKVIWEQSSASQMQGKKGLLADLSARPKPATITISHAISHGKVGAASGEVTLPDGNRRRFCHVFEFTNNKANCVAGVRSYS